MPQRIPYNWQISVCWHNPEQLEENGRTIIMFSVGTVLGGELGLAEELKRVYWEYIFVIFGLYSYNPHYAFTGAIMVLLII